MKLTFITVSSPAINHLIDAGNDIKNTYKDVLDLKLYYVGTALSKEKYQKMKEDMMTSDFIFTDLMGINPEGFHAVSYGMEHAKKDALIFPFGFQLREYLRLGKFTAGSMKGDKMPSNKALKKMQSMAEVVGKISKGKVRDMRNYFFISNYFKYASYTNILNMLYLILRDYGKKNLPMPKPPEEVEDMGVYDIKSKKIFKTLKEYEQCTDKKIGQRPVVLMLFYSQNYPNDSSQCIEHIYKKIEEHFDVFPISIAGSINKDMDKLRKFIHQLDRPIDLVVNLMSFRFAAGPMGGTPEKGIELLKEINAPVLSPFMMSRKTEKEWLLSTRGCSESEIIISVLLPELDGGLEIYPIGALSDGEMDEDYGVKKEELIVIEDRLDKLIGRIKKHIEVKNKPNSEKRVAIIGYNYPPGENNVFGGAFLDTSESIATILFHLKENRYHTSHLSKEKLLNIFLNNKVLNMAKYDYDEEDYLIFNKKKLRTDYPKRELVENNFGTFPGDIMITEDHRDFLIPGIELGNVFVGMQPARTSGEDDPKSYHDKNLPPHYQYMAFYDYLKKDFKADIIIHVGTHGTFEFLPGKECGLSKDCYPDYLVQDFSHIYIYYVGNPAESTIAKRRSYANLISYKPPIFVEGKLYGEYLNLKLLLDELHHDMLSNLNAVNSQLSIIKKEAEKLNLPTDLEELEKELYRMDTALIPKGLHIFGEPFSKEDAKDYVRGILRYDHKENKSLRKLIAEKEGFDLEELEDKKEYETIKAIDKKAKEFFEKYFNQDKKGLEKEFIQTLSYGEEIFKKVRTTNEMTGLLNVLSNGYNEAKLAGDIYRFPEILPTGNNLFQFDPRRVPSKNAYERGKKIAENSIAMYKKDHHSYPLSTAVVCWGIETSRTHGETVSQILYYIGVRLSKDSKLWKPKFDIIDLKELKRPRIDVTINICGFFRDMFPNLIDSLSDIFHEIYELDESEEENYFKKNTNRMYKKLLEEGYDKEEAKEYALSRIFGPEAGNYGSGITKLFETKSWLAEEEIGTMFMDNVSYVYSRNMHGKRVEDLYKENLKTVEIVTQIRSSLEYELTDLDHYYEYFGGLSKSVELCSGKKAKMYITDTTNDYMYTESVEKSINRGVRTRLLNPKWIDHMLEHEYHGLQHISDRFENIMGLSATTNSVEEWIYDDLHKKYVEDEELRERLKENNPYAYMKILNQMMEYSSRDYWDASKEQIEKIKEVYLELENEMEGEI